MRSLRTALLVSTFAAGFIGIGQTAQANAGGTTRWQTEVRLDAGLNFYDSTIRTPDGRKYVDQGGTGLEVGGGLAQLLIVNERWILGGELRGFATNLNSINNPAGAPSRYNLEVKGGVGLYATPGIMFVGGHSLRAIGGVEYVFTNRGDELVPVAGVGANFRLSDRLSVGTEATYAWNGAGHERLTVRAVMRFALQRSPRG